jgi:hypothetical protein
MYTALPVRNTIRPVCTMCVCHGAMLLYIQPPCKIHRTYTVCAVQGGSMTDSLAYRPWRTKAMWPRSLQAPSALIAVYKHVSRLVTAHHIYTVQEMVIRTEDIWHIVHEGPAYERRTQCRLCHIMSCGRRARTPQHGPITHGVRSCRFAECCCRGRCCCRCTLVEVQVPWPRVGIGAQWIPLGRALAAARGRSCDTGKNISTSGG